MDRLQLDRVGARRGELFRHSLQLGDDTVTLSNIATMAIESETFRPYQTPRNRRVMGLGIGLALLLGLVCVIAFVIAATGSGLLSMASLIGWISLAGCIYGVYLATRLAIAANRIETFYRLRIGASDGRQIDLVDDSGPTLAQIRDVIRNKIDSGDKDTVGTFDLDKDEVILNQAGPA